MLMTEKPRTSDTPYGAVREPRVCAALVEEAREKVDELVDEVEVDMVAVAGVSGLPLVSCSLSLLSSPLSSPLSSWLWSTIRPPKTSSGDVESSFSAARVRNSSRVLKSSSLHG
jgi:hypothetical protein